MRLRVTFGLLIVMVFALLTVVMSALHIYWVRTLVTNQAEQRLRRSMHAAWNVLEDRRQLLEAIAESLGQTSEIAGLLEAPEPEVREFLEYHCRRWGLDILTLLDPDGAVHVRAHSPRRGDRPELPAVLEALERERIVSGFTVIPADSLAAGGYDFGHRLIAGDAPVDAMALFAATTLRDASGEHHGFLVVGMLLNHAQLLLDKIQNTIFPNEFYEGKRVGTSTIFLGRVRIATTVLLADGRPAVGTLVSDEVADRVLDEGKPWQGPALVLSDRYLSRYDPIRDPSGKAIGMLYLGELAEIYRDIERNTLLTSLSIIASTMILAFALTFLLVNRILKQILALDRATQRFASGDLAARADLDTPDELGDLARSFNLMASIIEMDREEIVREKERAEAANRNYMGMLGFATHELRNSVGAALLNLKLLKDGSFGELRDDVPEGLDIIEKSLGYLEEISDSYLQLSRIERGEMTVTPSRAHVVRDVIKPVLDGKTAQLDARGLRVTVNVPDDLCVEADANLLRVVFENLIGNAIKYGCQGGAVTIDAAPGAVRTVLSVWNEGKAIEQHRLATLFDKFQRYDVDEAGGRRGSGLGLFIVKQIVDLHGGTVWAESKEGEGTRFSVALPKRTGEPVAAGE